MYHISIGIAKVLVKDDEEKNRLIAAGNDYNFVTNVDEILNDDEIQIVVELMGRIEPARTFITKALEAGKNVVSANKDLIATHGKELISLAQDKGEAARTFSPFSFKRKGIPLATVPKPSNPILIDIYDFSLKTYIFLIVPYFYRN